MECIDWTKKMRRYVKMIKSQRAKTSSTTPLFLTKQNSNARANNIVEMDTPSGFVQAGFAHLDSVQYVRWHVSNLKIPLPRLLRNVMENQKNIWFYPTNYRHQAEAQHVAQRMGKKNEIMLPRRLRMIQHTIWKMTKIGVPCFTPNCLPIRQMVQILESENRILHRRFEMRWMTLGYSLIGEAAKCSNARNVKGFLYHKMAKFIIIIHRSLHRMTSWIVLIYRCMASWSEKRTRRKVLVHCTTIDSQLTNEFFWSKSVSSTTYTIVETALNCDKKKSGKFQDCKRRSKRSEVGPAR
jgi:hypothetical protein